MIHHHDGFDIKVEIVHQQKKKFPSVAAPFAELKVHEKVDRLE